MGKKWKIEKKGIYKDIFILRAHIAEHRTWRILQIGRDISKIISAMPAIKGIIDWEIIKMDGITGQFEIVETYKK